MTVRGLYEKLNARIPKELSCDWDNDGLMCCKNTEQEVKKVLVALDVTEKIVEKAISEHYDTVVSHHPLVFHPLTAVNPDLPVAKKVIKLLENGISVMSFHTRLDAVEGGVNDTLAGHLNLAGVVPFADGIGRIGTLPKEMPLGEFAKRVKEVTGAPSLLLSDANLPVSRVAVLGGNGSDEVLAAKAAGADTYISGEIAHHHLTDAPETGINLIAAGHYYTEQPICKTLAGWIGEMDPALVVTVAQSNSIQIF